MDMPFEILASMYLARSLPGSDGDLGSAAQLKGRELGLTDKQINEILISLRDDYDVPLIAFDDRRDVLRSGDGEIVDVAPERVTRRGCAVAEDYLRDNDSER
jgi:hypothetical protein